MREGGEGVRQEDCRVRVLETEITVQITCILETMGENVWHWRGKLNIYLND